MLKTWNWIHTTNLFAYVLSTPRSLCLEAGAPAAAVIVVQGHSMSSPGQTVKAAVTWLLKALKMISLFLFLWTLSEKQSKEVTVSPFGAGKMEKIKTLMWPGLPGYWKLASQTSHSVQFDQDQFKTWNSKCRISKVSEDHFGHFFCRTSWQAKNDQKSDDPVSKGAFCWLPNISVLRRCTNKT